MSIITISEWQDWKANPITKAFYAACEFRVSDAKDILGECAGLDQATDNFYRGFIAAYNEMKEFKVEDLDDEG